MLLTLAKCYLVLVMWIGLLLLGFGYIGVGTAKYIYYIFRFRHVMELSWASVFGTISHAAWGLAIWLTAIASFLVRLALKFIGPRLPVQNVQNSS